MQTAEKRLLDYLYALKPLYHSSGMPFEAQDRNISSLDGPALERFISAVTPVLDSAWHVRTDFAQRKDEKAFSKEEIASHSFHTLEATVADSRAVENDVKDIEEAAEHVKQCKSLYLANCLMND